MQFAFCIYKYFPYGGIQRDGFRMAQALAQRGHSVRWYALSWEGEQPPGSEFVRVPVVGLSRHRLYARYQRWVAHHLADHPVDLVFGLNKMEGLHAYFAGDSCYEEKARTQRGWWYRRTPRYKFFARTETAVFQRLGATEILTISEQQTPLFQKYYRTPAERLHALPPGIDRSRIAPANAVEIGVELREELGIDQSACVLLFVGSGFRKKGLDRVLRGLHGLSADQRRKTQLLILGADNFDPFERMAKRLGVGSMVRFLSGRDDVPRFFFAADLLLLPAYDENTGTVILESLVAGLPVLTTANCGYAHYVSRVKAGAVLPEPFSQDQLNETLQVLLQGDVLPRMGRNGRELAESDEIFRLVPVATDLLEGFAQRRRNGTIAFCLFKYFPYGGLQRDFLRIALLCAQRGFSIRVYVLSWEGVAPPEFDIVVVPSRGIANHVSYASYQRWVRRDLRRAPVDCAVGFNKMSGLDVYFAADPCFEHKARNLRGWLYRHTPRYRFFSRSERAVFRKGGKTQVLLLTGVQKSQFMRYYETEEARLKLLPPGVPRDRYQPIIDAADRKTQRQAIDHEFSVPSANRLLVSIGSGFATKGVDRTLRSLAALPASSRRKTTLLVIGQDDPARYKAQASRLGLTEQVQFIGGRDDIPRFLQGADLLVHPAYAESGGIVLLEALVSGLPVLATESCGYADYIRRADAGVILTSEPFAQALLDATLAEVLDDAELRAKWRHQGMDFARTADLFELPERAADYIVAAAQSGVNE